MKNENYEIDQETIKQVAEAHLNFFRERSQVEKDKFGREKAMMQNGGSYFSTNETAEDYIKQNPNFNNYYNN